MKDLQNAFEETTKLLFGKALYQFEDYEEWLMRYVPKGKNCKSIVTGKELYLPNYCIFRGIPEHAVAGSDSFPELSKKQMKLEAKEDLQTIKQQLKDIDICIVEFAEGQNEAVRDSTIYLNLHHAYKTSDCFHSKYIAYDFWEDNCQAIFGGAKNYDCSFCINLYNSRLVTRGFEIDFCKNCSDVMFCHNCENVRDSLFCHNTKNKRYAIGNIEVGKDAYLEVRARLTGYVLGELEKKKTLDIDIYRLGAKG